MVVVTIDTAERGDPMQAARGFRDKHRLTYPFFVDVDGRGGRAFNVTALPTNVVIDAQGVVQYYGQGFDGNAIDQTLARLRRR